MQTPQVKGSVPLRLSPTLTPDTTESPGCYLCFWQSAVIWRTPPPSPQVHNFLKWFTEPRKRLLTRLPVHYKRIQLRNSHMEVMPRARYRGRGTELPCLLRVCNSFSTINHLVSFALLFNFFNGGYIILAWSIKSLTFGVWTKSPAPFPYLEKVRRGVLELKFQSSNHGAGSPGNQPPLLGAFQKSTLLTLTQVWVSPSFFWQV